MPVPFRPLHYPSRAWRGSSASRIPSPTMLKASVVNKITEPGMKTSQGASRMKR